MKFCWGILITLLLSVSSQAYTPAYSLDEALFHFNNPQKELDKDKISNYQSLLFFHNYDRRVKRLLKKRMVSLQDNPQCVNCRLPFVGFSIKSLKHKSIQLISDVFLGINKNPNKLFIGKTEFERYKALIEEFFSFIEQVQILYGNSEVYLKTLSEYAADFLINLNVNQTIIEEILIQSYVSNYSTGLRNMVVISYFKQKHKGNYKNLLDEKVITNIISFFQDKFAKKSKSSTYYSIAYFFEFAQDKRVISFLIQNFEKLIANMEEERGGENIHLILLGLMSGNSDLIAKSKRLLDSLFDLAITTSYSNIFGHDENQFQTMEGDHFYGGERTVAEQEYWRSAQINLNSLRSNNKTNYTKSWFFSSILRYFSLIQDLDQATNILITIIKHLNIDYEVIQQSIEFFAVSGLLRLEHALSKSLIIRLRGQTYLDRLTLNFKESEVKELIDALKDKNLNPDLSFAERTCFIRILRQYLNESESLNGFIHYILSNPTQFEHLPIKFYFYLLESSDILIREQALVRLRLHFMQNTSELFQRLSDFLSSESARASQFFYLINLLNISFEDLERNFLDRIKNERDTNKVRHLADFLQWYYQLNFSSNDFKKKAELLNLMIRNPDYSTLDSVIQNILSSQFENTIRDQYSNKLNELDSVRNYYVNHQNVIRNFSYLSSLEGPLLQQVYETLFLNGNKKIIKLIEKDIEQRVINNPEYLLYINYFFIESAAPSRFRDFIGNILNKIKSTSNSGEPVIRKDFVFINGGYSLYTNFDTSENDLLIFHNEFFGGHSYLINANGPGSLVTINDNLKDSLKDDSSIELNTRPGTLLPSLKATLENVGIVFDKIINNNPDQVTIVFGGHGNQLGLSLWNRKYLTEKSLRSFYLQFNSDTLIRSVFLQCHSATMLVNHYRVLPSSLDRMQRYLDTYFPANRCGFAMSMWDEVGQYFTKHNEGTKLHESRWFELKTRYYSPSLQNMKEYLQNDSEVKPTPTLTSDYFIQDIWNILCKETSNMVLNRELCLSEINTTYEEASKNYEQALDVKNNLWRQSIYWTYDLIKLRFPSVAAEFESSSSYQEVQKLISTYVAKNDQSELSVEEAGKINQLRYPTGPEEHQKLMAALPLTPKYKPYYDNKMKGYLKEHMSELPEDLSHYLDGNENPNTILSEVFEILDKKVQELQTDKKRRALSLFQFRREHIEKLMEQPEFSKIKERYDNIQYCESTPIN